MPTRLSQVRAFLGIDALANANDGQSAPPSGANFSIRFFFSSLLTSVRLSRASQLLAARRRGTSGICIRVERKDRSLRELAAS